MRSTRRLAAPSFAASRLGIDRRAGKKADIMREDNNKESRPLRSQGLAALRAAIVGAIDFGGGRSSRLLKKSLRLGSKVGRRDFLRLDAACF